MKLVDKVTVLPVVTRLDLDVERVLLAAIEAKPEFVVIIGEDAEGQLYFASSKADGGDILWWMEKAKRALMEISE
jgi:fructose-1,6-bisphosphatase/inositol monophosphatase family enzyme